MNRIFVLLFLGLLLDVVRWVYVFMLKLLCVSCFMDKTSTTLCQFLNRLQTQEQWWKSSKCFLLQKMLIYVLEIFLVGNLDKCKKRNNLGRKWKQLYLKQDQRDHLYTSSKLEIGTWEIEKINTSEILFDSSESFSDSLWSHTNGVQCLCISRPLQKTKQKW